MLQQCRGLAALIVCLLAGCAQQVVINTTFPEPIVESLPINVGVRYTDAFRQYTYTEDVPNDVKWSFALGDANVLMFDSALNSMFRSVTAVSTPGGTGATFDELQVIIEPEIEAGEWSLPRQSRSDQYGAWIRYIIRLYAPDGTLQASWPLSAYGQSDSRMLRGSNSMESAVIQAMRDGIASVVIGFTLAPQVRAVLYPDAEPAITAIDGPAIDALQPLMDTPETAQAEDNTDTSPPTPELIEARDGEAKSR